jgi:hypothetical protein
MFQRLDSVSVLRQTSDVYLYYIQQGSSTFQTVQIALKILTKPAGH